ncbi:hypothetical protein V0288_16460 [Pannus brasiliensis CCIBt3594]|uniref:Uncharacterized protein n=1 Tax=Pannus brasiliensis CCIBt3594 TaxID=1427578 RepID=A0AAW9QLQ6_9CHRO
MKRSIDIARKIVFRFFVLILVELALMLGLAIGNSIPAFAADTPDYPIYGGRMNREVRKAPADLPNVDEKPESVTKTIVERLNLDEPIPDSTKKFFEQIKGNAPIENATHPELYNNGEK